MATEQEIESISLPEAPIIDEVEKEVEDLEAQSLPHPVAKDESESAGPGGFGLFLMAAPPSANTVNVTPDVLKALNLHNNARRGKGVGPLAYDKNLEAGARQWAEHLANNVRSLQHSTGAQRPNQGENLYWASGGNFAKEPCASGTQSWLDEAKFYTGQKTGDPAKGVIGHYSEFFFFFSLPPQLGCET